MSDEKGSRRTLEDIIGNQTLIDEVNTLATSSKDVSWGENMVVIVLRTEDEIRRARLMDLNPVGTTLVIVRKSMDGTVIHSDEVIRRAVQVIKGSQAE